MRRTKTLDMFENVCFGKRLFISISAEYKNSHTFIVQSIVKYAHYVQRKAYQQQKATMQQAI